MPILAYMVPPPIVIFFWRDAAEPLKPADAELFTTRSRFLAMFVGEKNIDTNRWGDNYYRYDFISCHTAERFSIFTYSNIRLFFDALA